MLSHATPRTRVLHAEREQEILRRINHVAAELEEARTRMHRTQDAVHAAEECLMARRLECEAAALEVAELADLLESLQQQM